MDIFLASMLPQRYQSLAGMRPTPKRKRSYSVFCANQKKIAYLVLGVAWLLLNLSYPFQAIAQDQLLQEPYKSKA